MTVREAIKYLNALPDKELMLMVDCPYCGRGAQLAKIFEAVILQSKETDEGKCDV